LEIFVCIIDVQRDFFVIFDDFACKFAENVVNLQHNEEFISI